MSGSLASLRKLIHSEPEKHNSFEDLRAAFICINNGPNGYFKSSQELIRGK